ncbi:NnrU family protein [Oceanibacterium hippocampi]|uniref:NnrU protein n=1 Tax=Oceanibacterium hippocampi TaxID=745714 RepID=A0A1Y5SDQ5_9PROT|nr:NnrU family protein [Oceanibacterium hippocampi]SLN38039.1 NnrU protein [Oceanibacterium hippocampi]
MTGSLAALVLASACFLVIHVLPSTAARGRLVARLGEGAYRGLYSAISLVLIVWMSVAYGAVVPETVLWDLGAAGRWCGLVLMAIAFVLLIAGVGTPNPTAAGSERLLQKGVAARGIVTITRNPIMWAIAIWSAAHLLNNGDLPSLVFFGSLGLLAIAGTMLIEARKARAFPGPWKELTAVTSNVPFAALLSGRGRFSLGGLWWQAPLGLVFYAAFLHGHAWLFGVSPLPL